MLEWASPALPDLTVLPPPGELGEEGGRLIRRRLTLYTQETPQSHSLPPSIPGTYTSWLSPSWYWKCGFGSGRKAGTNSTMMTACSHTEGHKHIHLSPHPAGREEGRGGEMTHVLTLHS